MLKEARKIVISSKKASGEPPADARTMPGRCPADGARQCEVTNLSDKNRKKETLR